MNDEQLKQRIFEFLQSNEVGVVSTIHTDHIGIESAVVAITQTQELEIIFGTSNKSRKYANLQKNGHVAFVVGFSSATGTLQFEGIAEELATNVTEEFKHMLIKKNQNNKINIVKDDYTMFKVKPTWIRLLVTSGDNHGKFEVTF